MRQAHSVSFSWIIFRWIFLPLVVGPAVVFVIVMLWWQGTANISCFWLMPLVFWLCRDVARINGDTPSLRLATYVPTGAALILGLASSLIARQFASEPDIRPLIAFIAVSVTLLLFMLAWILLFPFEKAYSGWSPQQLRTWRVAWRSAAVLAGTCVLYYALHYFRGVEAIRRRPFEQFDIRYFQWCALKGSFVVFVFFVIRAYVPWSMREMKRAIASAASAPDSAGVV